MGVSETLRIASANANLPIFQLMGWGIGQHEEFLYKTGYDGFEIHPFRNRFMQEARLGSLALAEIVSSLHQSFRTDSPRELLHIPTSADRARRLMAKTAFITTLPRLEESLKSLYILQATVGRRLPIVLYPNEQSPPHIQPGTADYTTQQGRFGPRLWQPTADVLQAWKVLDGSTDDVAGAMRLRGFDGICFDTYHWPTERRGLSMPAWQAALPELVKAGEVHEVHVGLGRTDFRADSDSLGAVLAGRLDRIELGDMLTCVKENSQNELPLFVTEMPASNLAEGQVGSRNLVEVHREVVTAIREHVG